MENCTIDLQLNCTGREGSQASPGVLEAFGIVILALAGVAFVLIVPTIIAVCMAHTIPRGLRMYLVSTLVSGLLINTLSAISGLIVCIRAFWDAPLPPLGLCRFILWGFYATTTARSFSVVGYSIMVLSMVRYGKNMKILYFILSLCLVWGLSLLLNTQVLIPQVFSVGFAADAVCLQVQNDTIILEANIFSTVFRLIHNSLVPPVVCIVVPLIVLCYIRKHDITGSTDYTKAAAKLGLFLVTGSLINSIGLVVNAVLLYAGEGERVFFVYIIATLSVYPTPIVIIIFLKSVRENIKALLKCKCVPDCRSAPKIDMRNQHQLQEQVYDSLLLQQHV